MMIHPVVLCAFALAALARPSTVPGQIDRSSVPDAARVLPIPGGPGWIALWNDAGAPHYAISLDGLTVDRHGPTSYDLLLRYDRFDPLAREPVVPPALTADPDSVVRIVQFVTQPLPEQRALVESAGGRLAAYLGNHAYIVRLAAGDAAKLREQPLVRWVGPFHPAYRLEEPLLKRVHESGPAERYSILALPSELGRAAGDAPAVARDLEALGATVVQLAPESNRLEALLTPGQLLAAARLDSVLFIDRTFPITTYMDNVRIVGGANMLEQVAGFTGAGVRGEVMDSNLFETHQDFQRNPPVFHGGRAGSASHGTSVFGIVFGTGVGNAAARGLLPDAQGIFADYGNLSNRAAHIAQLNQSPYFAVFQTNSWGSCCTTAYTTQAADMDSILFQNDLLLLQAQANSGSTDSDVIAFAKNLVSVGGIRHFGTLSLSDDRWQNAGSIGPASDGRIKPDLAFWYDNILTTSSSGAYTTGFGGTSAATPITAGHFGLFFQMWSAGIFGNPVDPGATVFQNRPHMSTAKAMLINSATPYAFAGTTADLTRTHQGWGRADVLRLYNLRNSMFIVNETDPLANLETRTYALRVAPNTAELRATLVYTDPAGTPNAARHRVNNLSLRVRSPSGFTYWGNAGLLAANESLPAGVENVVDTVENVWLKLPAPGVWTIEVIASEIVQDQHLETMSADADYALVISGVIPPADCLADFNADGELDPDDLGDFIDCYFALPPCSEADVNADAVVDPDDLGDFINAFFMGC
ncbi:MAG: S8 family serine peptidase [Phycisphaerales bacterium]